MAEHPGIVFRDGPAGRRAALGGGPDIWEIIETLQGSGRTGERAISVAAKWGNLTSAQVRVAIRYYGDFRDEIDDQIRLNREQAERQHAGWERAQAALG